MTVPTRALSCVPSGCETRDRASGRKVLPEQTDGKQARGRTDQAEQVDDGAGGGTNAGWEQLGGTNACRRYFLLRSAVCQR